MLSRDIFIAAKKKKKKSEKENHENLRSQMKNSQVSDDDGEKSLPKWCNKLRENEFWQSVYGMFLFYYFFSFTATGLANSNKLTNSTCALSVSLKSHKKIIRLLWHFPTVFTPMFSFPVYVYCLTRQAQYALQTSKQKNLSLCTIAKKQIPTLIYEATNYLLKLSISF